MNFISKLFGLNKRFGRSTFFRLLGYKGEVWIDVDKPYRIYNDIPEVNLVIDRKANMFSNAVVLIERKSNNGEWAVIEKPDVMKLIEKPNFNKSQNEFYLDVSRHYDVYGNSFQYYNSPSKFGAVSRFAMSPRYIKPELTGKYFDQLDFSGAVSSYIYDDGMNTRKPYNVDEIMWIANSDIDNPIMGRSKLRTLKYPSSNIEAAYSYRNAILTKKGMLGFIVNKSTEMGSIKPMSKEDKDALNKQYSEEYGHGDNQTAFAVLSGDADFKTTTYPTKDLLLFEEVEANRNTIAQMYGLNTNLFENNTTYENLKNGIVQSYQDAIFPFADLIAQKETAMFQKLNMLGANERIRFSYDHISILQENNLQTFQSLERAVSALNNALQNGIVTQQQATTVIDSLIARIS